MSVLVLMYHRARAGPLGNAPDLLDEHFACLRRTCACVLPGEPLAAQRRNVCLTFDDGYFDFYAVVFPLLQKHGLRALLAVIPSVVRERTEASADARLGAPAVFEAAQGDAGAFCLWSELQEMAESGHVSIAAHGFTHCPLDRDGVDLHTEVVMPQTLLAARLGQPVDSFVFPYGRFSSPALRRVRQTYRHAFRIGGGDNRSWDGGLLYRVSADNLAAPDALFRSPRLALYRFRRLWNQARGR